MADGVDAVAAEALRLWPRARTDGLVSGEWGSARAAAFGFVRDLRQRAATGAEVKLIAARILSRHLGRLMTIHLLNRRAFEKALTATWQHAAAQGWTASRYKATVVALADAWSTGHVAGVWTEGAVLQPYFEAGQRAALQPQAFGKVFPYLQQRTRADEAVRLNHKALHGFVAASDWAGWSESVAPPLGWNCRCRIRRVDFLEAQERRLSGEFPAGTAKLEEFRALGGPDAGFPREVFVSTL